MRRTYKPLHRRESKAFALNKKEIQKDFGKFIKLDEDHLENIDEYWKIAAEELEKSSSVDGFSDCNLNEENKIKEEETPFEQKEDTIYKSEDSEEITGNDIEKQDQENEDINDKSINNISFNSNNSSSIVLNDTNLQEMESDLQLANSSAIPDEKFQNENSENILTTNSEFKENEKNFISKNLQYDLSILETSSETQSEKKDKKIKKSISNFDFTTMKVANFSPNKKNKSIYNLKDEKTRNKKHKKEKKLSVHDKKTSTHKIKSGKHLFEIPSSNNSSIFEQKEIYSSSFTENSKFTVSNIKKLSKRNNTLVPLISTNSLETAIIFMEFGAKIVKEISPQDFSLYIIKGHLKIVNNGIEVDIKKDSICVIERDSVYSVEALGLKGNTFLVSYSIRRN
ncbi:hypothetical protein CWI38_0007p0110 [Hamiltosporidium tvaerminnensis]|uniref:Uncharacterized protein n=1 Tax=Hamiltosporidium tvaerminnensis TaxID=1176355 RepID=A0A4Q9M2H0_9MICR|nr:hypothetical protein CWI38_0007p0110 [Hamiltosporidium tvaerminnensis]